VRNAGLVKSGGLALLNMASRLAGGREVPALEDIT
jgi:hypothetical protein